MKLPPMILREGLRSELRGHPSLKRYVRWSGEFGPIDDVGVGVGGIKPIETAIREERATGAAMNNEGTERITQCNLEKLQTAQRNTIEVLTTSRARPILQRRRVVDA